MSNQLHDLLQAWQDRPEGEWVFGTVYRTEGSAYRKAGAMMLISACGQQLGLLSGGCLESDIVLNARKVLQSGTPRLLVYDGNDEDDLSFQLGIGCGGMVYIMLQPVTGDNDLNLGALYTALTKRQAGRYQQKIGTLETCFELVDDPGLSRAVIESRDDGDWLVTPINPEPHLLVIGGGVDARPLAGIAAQLGWRVTLADPRPANARREYFPHVRQVLRELDDSLTRYIDEQRVDAAVIMSHNVEIDATALKLFQHSQLTHIALLGPRHRYLKVLECAGLTEAGLCCPVSAPAGLDIGGQLPESIALSILAECHAVLHQAQSVPALQLAVP